MNASNHRHIALLLTLTAALLPLSARAQKPVLPPVPALPPTPPVVLAAEVEEVHSEDGVRQAEAAAQRAQVEVQRAMRDVNRKLATINLGVRGPSSSRLLVVPAADAPAEELGKTREDLTIMSRVLQKAASPDGAKRGGFRFNFGDLRLGDRSELDALYLDGFGAVFLLDVDFPLSEPPKAENKKAEGKEPRDAAWEQARRELAGKGGPHEDWGADVIHEDEEDAPAFDADKVAGLKKRLTEALRSASNIRALKGGEQVVVQVHGRAPKHPQPVVAQGRKGGVGGAYRSAVFVGDTGATPAATTLTLRAKKSQIEDFAAGKLDAAEFAKKITITLREESEPPVSAEP